MTLNYILFALLFMCLILICYKFIIYKQPTMKGYDCTIISYNNKIQNNEYGYTVLVETNNGTYKINVISKYKNLTIGSKHVLNINEQGIYFI